MNRPLAAIALAISLAASAPSIRASDVRVDLFTKTGMKEIVLTPGTAAVEICEGEGRTPCLTARPGETARCVAESAILRCSVGNTSRTFKRLSAQADSVFRLDTVPRDSGANATMRGVMVRAADIRPAQGSLRAVVVIDLETYVSGVLAGEAATFTSSAAMEAMAVVSRTWALASRGRHRADGYDFCSLTHCQFFRPPLAQSGNVAAAHAVERTTGLVLKYQGKIIDAYYSAHCGGRTASAASVWPDRAAPYLASVLDPYCARDGQRSWEQAIPWAAISRVLKEEMDPGLMGPIRDLLVDQKDDSGRVRTLRLVSGSSRPIDANAFRYALNRRLGWNTLKSNLYTIHHGESGPIFRGRGLGHGVGLCQAGADHMGQVGIGFERILAHYFPGTSIESADGGERLRVLSSAHFELHFPATEEPLVARSLEFLEAERARLGTRSRLLPARISVRTHASTGEFIRVTGQPGWVSGSTDGRSIELQPLSVLESRGILRSTLHHELLHLVIHRLRARTVPDWYEEGMILHLTGEQVSLPPAISAEASTAAARAKMESSYALARERVAELARRRGEEALWQVLAHPTPDDVNWFKAQR
jgi:stage II sporulation protein D